jgi:hypothetical protein
VTLAEEFEEKTGGGYDDYPNHDEVAHELGAEFVTEEIADTTRWGYISEVIYKRGDDYVRVTYEAGSGDSDIPYEPTFTRVRPVEKTVTVYQ